MQREKQCVSRREFNRIGGRSREPPAPVGQPIRCHAARCVLVASRHALRCTPSSSRRSCKFGKAIDRGLSCICALNQTWHAESPSSYRRLFAIMSSVLFHQRAGSFEINDRHIRYEPSPDSSPSESDTFEKARPVIGRANRDHQRFEPRAAALTGMARSSLYDRIAGMHRDIRLGIKDPLNDENVSVQIGTASELRQGLTRKNQRFEAMLSMQFPITQVPLEKDQCFGFSERDPVLMGNWILDTAAQSQFHHFGDSVCRVGSRRIFRVRPCLNSDAVPICTETFSSFRGSFMPSLISRCIPAIRS